MSDIISHNYDASSEQKRSARQEQSSEQSSDPIYSPPQSAVNARPLASSRAIRGRGNGSARAGAMLSMQQMHGNRAVQRQIPPNPYTSVPEYTPWSMDPFEIPPNPYNVPQDPFMGPGNPYELPPNPYTNPMDFPGEPFNPDDYPSPVLEGEALA